MKLIQVKQRGIDNLLTHGMGELTVRTRETLRSPIADIKTCPIGSQLIGLRITHVLLDVDDVKELLALNFAPNRNYLISLLSRFEAKKS